MASTRERALLALPSVLVCILDTSRAEGQEYLLYSYPPNSPLLPLKAMLLATHQVAKGLLKQDVQCVVLAGHKAVLLPLFDCFLIGVILPRVADTLICSTAKFIRELIRTLCPGLDAFLKSPGHADEINPTPRASRTSARDGNKADVAEQMKSSLDPIAQLALYRLIPFFSEETDDFGSSPVSEFYYTLPLSLDACVLHFPLPLDILVDVTRALNSIYQDSSVVVHEIITIDCPHSYPIGSALFHNGFLLSASLSKAQMQACTAVCLLWDLFSRTDSSPHFARTTNIWVDGRQDTLTVVADFSLVLCLALEPLDDKDQIGYDPVFLGKAEKALQILVRYDLHTKVSAELAKLSVSPEAAADAPLPSMRRRYSSTPTDAKAPVLSQLSVYSQGEEMPLQPMFVRGSELPLFHFAGCSDSGLIFSHQVSASPDWFFLLYRPVLHTYSLFNSAALTKYSEVAIRLQINTTSPYRKQEAKLWQVWVGRHRTAAGVVHVCYDEESPKPLRLLAHTLIS